MIVCVTLEQNFCEERIQNVSDHQEYVTVIITLTDPDFADY